jgi:hypothetical protein
VIGDTITVTGSASNNDTYVIANLSATVITLGSEDLDPEVAAADCTVYGTPTLTFAEVGASGDTLTRSRGSWLSDGFRIGDAVSFDGTANNDALGGTLTNVTATVLTFGSTPSDLAAEVIGSFGVTVLTGESKAQWMATVDEEFAPIDDAPRINLSAGRARVTSSFTGYDLRRPAGWFASWREYQHDLHVPTWRKQDGPVRGDLFDLAGSLVEWDDRVDGGAGVAARFTCLRTWGNGPNGAFVALDLQRAVDDSLLVHRHNEAVTNLVCTIVQAATENVIGRVLVLNDDGTATADSLSVIRAEVNAALQNGVLQNARGEGPRASKAVWTPSTDDILNVPEAALTGVVDLNLNSAIHTVNTSVNVISGGQ